MKTSPAILLIMAALACPQLSLPASHAQEAPSTKIVRLLESSDFSYTKAANNVWSVPFQGEVLDNFNLVVSLHQDVLVLFVVVAEKKGLRVTPELMQKMLMLNSELDRVKVGIDKDGDAFVRIDLSVRVLDLQEFKENVNQAAASADTVFKAIKPFTTVTK